MVMLMEQSSLMAMVDASANAFAEIETKTAFNVGNLI